MPGLVKKKKKELDRDVMYSTTLMRTRGHEDRGRLYRQSGVEFPLLDRL